MAKDSWQRQQTEEKKKLVENKNRIEEKNRDRIRENDARADCLIESYIDVKNSNFVDLAIDRK